MGTKASTSAFRDSSNLTQPKNIEKNYIKHIYIENKVSLPQFCGKITSIIKRLEYLPYPWAQTIKRKLQNEERRELYQNYKSLLKENCSKDGWSTRIIYYSQITSIFMKFFSEKAKELMKTVSKSDLVGLMTESKAYLMILNWLYQLTSITPYENIKNVIFCQPEEQRIYRGLINLAQRYFEKTIPKGQKMKQFQSILADDIELLSLIRQLNKRITFRERELIVEKLESMLVERELSTTSLMLELEVIFGKAVVLAHLWTIVEMGTANIASLQSYLACQHYI